MTTRMSEAQAAALERLTDIAQRDTGQSRIVADFLLAWWNAGECGGFDLTDLWSVDSEIARDIVEIVRMIAQRHQYPDTLGYRTQFNELERLWRTSTATEG
jgi:hypothetical protein